MEAYSFLSVLHERERQCTEFFGRAAVIVNDRAETSGCDIFHIIRKLSVQVKQDISRQFFRGHSGFQACQMADVLCDYRADAGKACIERLRKRRRLFGQCEGEGVSFYGERIVLRHGVRYKICSAGQYFTHRTHLCGNVLDAVDDRAFIVTENDIAVFAHDFYDQLFPAQIPQLIQMFYIQVDDSLKLWLGNVCDTAVPDMFSEKHTEIRGGHRSRFIFF